MAIEHVSIADAQRHEPKHASTALINQVNKSNGDGTTKYDYVNWSEIAGKPSVAGYSQVLYGASAAASQQPSATNSPIQIEFGSAQSFTDVSLSGLGVLTFNTAGNYLVDIFLRFGRTTGTGSAIMFNRLLINGVQTLSSNSITMTDVAATIPFSASIPITATAGMTLAMEIMRDSAGINNGGIFRTVPSLGGWIASPSGSILVSKFTGLT